MKLLALSIIFQIGFSSLREASPTRGFSSRGFANANANGTLVSILPMGAAQMQHSPPHNSFRSIEQPLPLKISVVLGGLTLIGGELWWFLGRKQQQQQARQTNGVQERGTNRR